MIFKTGDKVLIEGDGRKVLGEVVFASANGVSLMLGFETVLVGHVGMMPVLRNDEGGFNVLITGLPIKLTLV